jgi:phosphoglucosamine mutase
MLAVDNTGSVVDGDKCIAICAQHLKQLGRLKNNTVVVTVMSNFGFFRFCDKNGIKCEKTKVGDRFVLEKMSENGFCLGGEQSGHIIFLEHATTGDGQLSAIKLLTALKFSGKTLKELSDEIETYPQMLINVTVSDFGKAQFSKDKEIQNAIRQAEKELGDEGRILVRLSGTEPLVRVMLEGKNSDKINELGESVAQVIRERLV